MDVAAPTLLTVRLLGHELSLATYGFFLLLALAAAAGVTWLAHTQRSPLPARTALSLAAWAAAGALLGARALGLLFPAIAHRSPIHLAPDGALLGGLAGALAFAAARAPGLPRFLLLDALAPGAAAAHAVASLGCLATGCCAGPITAAGSTGVRFVRGSVAWQELVARGELPFGAPHTPPLAPYQLWHAAAWLATALLALIALAAWPGRARASAVFLAGAAANALLWTAAGPLPLVRSCLFALAALACTLRSSHAPDSSAAGAVLPGLR